MTANGPYEIALEYAAGAITRERVIELLATYRYDESDVSTDGIDTLLIDAPAARTFDEVSRAYREGLLDAKAYDAVVEHVVGV